MSHSAAADPHASFPIIAVAVIGILATAFLLVGYYIFVIKCCLSWHQIDLLRRFSFSRRRPSAADPLVAAFSPAVLTTRGLDAAAIRSIPIFNYAKSDSNSTFECSVCLNEFHQGEKLRAIPNCAHAFHIDCIDIWLQNNANCPLCRASISARPETLIPPFGPGPNPNINAGGDEEDRDYIVIEIGSETDPSLLRRTREETRSNAVLPIISPSPRKLYSSWSRKKASKKLSHASSMGDECIDIKREKEEEFVVESIRRSFSMDSAADSQLYLAVQQIIQRRDNEINQHEGCSSRVKRSFFSLRGSRNAVVQPVALDPTG